MDSGIARKQDERVSGRPVVFRRRWFILFILAWLNLTNGVLWISFASIADRITLFYNVTLDSVNYLSLVFPVGTIALGLPTVWGMDTLGLRVTCLVCGWLNLGSALMRFISSDSFVPLAARYPLAMSGQVLGALAQPLAMFSPARLAALWFPQDQRALATTLSAMGNPLGVLVGSVLPPFLAQVTLFSMAAGLLAMALIGALLPTLGLQHTRPPVMPIQSIADDFQQPQESLRQQLRLCFTNRAFVVLAIAFGVGLGLFTALSTLFQQILSPRNYPDEFAGICGAVLIAAGLIGSVISGVLADKTKAFAEIVQFCLVNATLGVIAFSVLATYAAFEGPIMVTVVWVGAFGVALYSVALELAAEVSFPVSENLSSGLLVVSGQIFSVVFIVISQFLHFPVLGPLPSNSNSDYWLFNAFMSGVAVLACSLMLLGFSARYDRRNMEATWLYTHDDVTDTDVEISISR